LAALGCSESGRAPQRTQKPEEIGIGARETIDSHDVSNVAQLVARDASYHPLFDPRRTMSFQLIRGRKGGRQPGHRAGGKDAAGKAVQRTEQGRTIA
jgi:hypothetical protein